MLGSIRIATRSSVSLQTSSAIAFDPSSALRARNGPLGDVAISPTVCPAFRTRPGRREGVAGAVVEAAGEVSLRHQWLAELVWTPM
jgi:hypothetical protein